MNTQILENLCFKEYNLLSLNPQDSIYIVLTKTIITVMYNQDVTTFSVLLDHIVADFSDWYNFGLSKANAEYYNKRWGQLSKEDHKVRITRILKEMAKVEKIKQRNLDLLSKNFQL